LAVRREIVIVGGGIAGLAAAYYASRRAPDLRITVLESDSRWGGKITTDRVDFAGGSFVIEGGPDTFLATKPYATRLCKDLGIEDRLHGTNPKIRNTYVLSNGRLLPLPDGLAMMVPTNLPGMLRTRLVSWAGKARMGMDLLLPARALDGDESLGAFISRRLGREAYEKLIEPLVSGIYAGDGDQLSLGSTFPYLRDLEIQYGSLARGALTRRRERSLGRGQGDKGWRSAFLTPTTGLAEMVEALVDQLRSAGVELRPGVAASNVTKPEGKFRIDAGRAGAIGADYVILATPAFASGMLLEALDPALAEELAGIPYASTATVSLAYREADVPRPLDGYGYVIPRREGRAALACTWTSTKFPHRAPEGYALIRVFVGRAGQDVPWDEPSLLAIAREEAHLTLGITTSPLIARVFRWEKAMPQYNLGHPERLMRIEAALKRLPGLALAGNAYRGIGIPDCIRSGELAVDRILATEEVKPYEHV
jgi:oxygen-dependent protoporphyrinogen oxidase